jgi:hypothetical protein
MFSIRVGCLSTPGGKEDRKDATKPPIVVTIGTLPDSEGGAASCGRREEWRVRKLSYDTGSPFPQWVW